MYTPSMPTSGWRYTLSSLANADFLRLWLGLVLGWGGFQMQMVARGFLVYEITGSATVLGLVAAGGNMPFLVLSLFGGAVADRVDRKRLIQAGHGGLAVIRLLVAVSITTGAVTWVLLLAASMLQGALVAFMTPATQALVPQIVGRQKLGNAIALNAAGMSTAALVAPALGGVLYAMIGADGVYYVIAATALASMVLTISIPRIGGRAEYRSSPMLSDIKAGLSYIWRSPLVLALLAIGVINVHLASPLTFLLPVFVVDVYHRESQAFGLLISMMGLGALAGSLFIASLGRQRRGMLLLVGSLVSGLALLLVASVPLYLAALGIMVTFGLGTAVQTALNQALVLENVEEGYHGRVMSVFMMNVGLLPFGVLLVAFAMDLLGSQYAVGILGAVLLAAAIVALTTQKRLRILE